MADNHRDRLPVELDVVISCSRFGLLRGKATNLGMDGISILTDARAVSLCSEVSISFGVEAGGLTHVEVAGEVSDQSDRGIDVHFREVNPRTRRQLDTFLRRYGKTQTGGFPEIRYA